MVVAGIAASDGTIGIEGASGVSESLVTASGAFCRAASVWTASTTPMKLVGAVEVSEALTAAVIASQTLARGALAAVTIPEAMIANVISEAIATLLVSTVLTSLVSFITLTASATATVDSEAVAGVGAEADAWTASLSTANATAASAIGSLATLNSSLEEVLATTIVSMDADEMFAVAAFGIQ